MKWLWKEETGFLKFDLQSFISGLKLNIWRFATRSGRKLSSTYRARKSATEV